MSKKTNSIEKEIQEHLEPLIQNYSAVQVCDFLAKFTLPGVPNRVYEAIKKIVSPRFHSNLDKIRNLNLKNGGEATKKIINQFMKQAIRKSIFAVMGEQDKILKQLENSKLFHDLYNKCKTNLEIIQ